MDLTKKFTSPDLLIHPGETLLEVIQDRNISQKELALRTGFSEKHVSTVISGKKSISSEFALKLEYALSIPAYFWRNLQTNYDFEVASFNEMYGVTDTETKIANEISKPVKEILGDIPSAKNEFERVYFLRKILNVSNLETISALNKGYYRAQFDQNTSENIMYAWQYLCEKEVENQTEKTLDILSLKNKLQKIKNIMHEPSEKHIELIKKELNECGILFTVKKHVKGAPVKGLTVNTSKNQVMIALTIRGKFVDIFWFTLFHEIGHVINGNINNKQKNTKENGIEEKEADLFASNILIDKAMYNKFIQENDFSYPSIEKFAMINNVLPTIVIGRLMNDKKISWANSNLRTTYQWVK